ncbi:MAG: ABC transporter permease [Lachnospiraceae bacterium]|nr:ABC transporter permease [Lachnospiraceae bacterium]
MRLIHFIYYDIKRLFGHGKAAVLAMLSPLFVLILFAAFLAPMLSAGDGVAVSCALYNEDESGMIQKLLDIVIAEKIEEGMARVYPVQSVETGKRLVDEGKVAVFVYIPPNTYNDSVNGKPVNLEFYYSPVHAFESMTFFTSVRSFLSVFGQGIRLVYVAGELAIDHGLSRDEVIDLWRSGTEEIIRIHMHRGRVIGIDGFLLPSGDDPIRFGMAVLFGICAYFASFPVICLTGLDVSGPFQKRILPPGNVVLAYFARLFSGSLLILCTFLIMYPVARAIRSLHLDFALSVLPAMLLCALTFSALAILIGSLCSGPESSLWAGLYVGIVLILGIVFAGQDYDLPPVLMTLLRLSPLRAAVSVFSNAMFREVTVRYRQDMLVLLAACVIFMTAGCLNYIRREHAV